MFLGRPSLLPFPLRVQGEGLPCDAGCRLAEVVTDPSLASLKDVVFCRLLSRSLLWFLIGDGVRPTNLEIPSEAGVDESVWTSFIFFISYTIKNLSDSKPEPDQ